jgi:hypothetical protein
VSQSPRNKILLSKQIRARRKFLLKAQVRKKKKMMMMMMKENMMKMKWPYLSKGSTSS